MNGSKIFKRALLLLAAVLGAFFLGRGLWAGAQGMSGSAQFARQDWLRAILFVLAGVRLILFVRRRLQNGW